MTQTKLTDTEDGDADELRADIVGLVHHVAALAVMAMRIVLDGDHTFDAWRAAKGLDPLMTTTRQAITPKET